MLYSRIEKYLQTLRSGSPPIVSTTLSPMAVLSKSLTLLGLLGVATAALVDSAVLNACPGYKATNIRDDGSTLTADLSLAGQACNVFGTDIEQLKLQVAYETGTISRI